MLKEKSASESSLLADLLSFASYKPTQGIITRRSTMVAIWAMAGLAAYKMYYFLELSDRNRAITCAAVLAGGLWLGYRLVNWHAFADFLIAVEAEMNKVSWPSKGELIRSSVVVIFMLLSLAVIVAVLDMFWESAFWLTGVWRISSVIKEILNRPSPAP